MNLQDIDDDDLDVLRGDVAVEIERRATLISVPSQVRELADKYELGGGSRADLIVEVEGT